MIKMSQLINIYSGNCLYCKSFVDVKKGIVKIINPQKGEDLNKKRSTKRQYGVLCINCGKKYNKI